MIGLDTTTKGTVFVEPAHVALIEPHGRWDSRIWIVGAEDHYVIAKGHPYDVSRSLGLDPRPPAKPQVPPPRRWWRVWKWRRK